MSISDLSFVESGEGSIVDDGFSHLRYNYAVDRRVIGEAFVQGQYDRSQDLSRRFVVGAGIRLLAIDRAHTTAAIGLAIMQEHEELVSGESTNLARNSNYVTISYRNGDRFTAGTITYVQPAIENLDDLRVLSEIKCTAWITRARGMTSSLTYNYDSKPPAGVREYDLETTSGATLRF